MSVVKEPEAPSIRSIHSFGLGSRSNATEEKKTCQQGNREREETGEMMMRFGNAETIVEIKRTLQPFVPITLFLKLLKMCVKSRGAPSLWPLGRAWAGLDT